MWKAVQPVVPVLLGIILIEAALGITGTLIGVQLADRDVSASLIGVVFSAYNVGFLLGTLTCERMINNVGHIRAFGVFAVSAAIATLLFALTTDVYAWTLFKGLSGYALAGGFIVIESWLNDKATELNRGRIFAVYMVVTWGAGGLSPLTLNIAPIEGDFLFKVCTILMAASMIPLALTKIGNPEVGHKQSFGVRKLIQASPTGVVCCFASGLFTGSLYSLLPAYTEAVGFGARELSILIAVGTAAALIVQLPVGYVADHYGRRPVIIGTNALAGALALAIAMAPSLTFTGLLVLFFAMTMFQSPLYALGVGQTNDYVDRKDFVRAAAGLLFVWGLGASVGPTLVGLVMDAIGETGLFYYVGIGYGLVALFALYRVFRRRAKTPKEQSDYVPVPNIQAVYGAPELDPRGEFQQSARSRIGTGFEA
ncbi:MFS transporter [Dongia deserti]|uniref:MFS transporter n=1 Tax=Dongia deserti TaxID=2268030 RepID=UPI000E657772|nr:MFS transporter [Dongia deserti]